jgi:hypothetical protein
VTETGAKFNLGLDKRVAVLVERNQEHLLHLHRELAEALQRLGRDVREHLRAEDLQDLVVHDRVRLGHQAGDGGSVRDLAVVRPERRPERADGHLKLIEAVRADRVQEAVEMIDEPRPQLAGGEPVRALRVRSDRVLDRRELGELADRAGVVRTAGRHRKSGCRGEATRASCIRRLVLAETLLRGRTAAADGGIVGHAGPLLGRLGLGLREQGGCSWSLLRRNVIQSERRRVLGQDEGGPLGGRRRQALRVGIVILLI